MNVKLAAQVLGCIVSKTLTSYEPPEAAGTAKFCLLMDSFGWLQNFLLKYFEDWLTSIEQHHGNFSRNAHSNMFISWQTFEGLKITVHSIIKAVSSATSCQICFDRKVLSRPT